MKNVFSDNDFSENKNTNKSLHSKKNFGFVCATNPFNDRVAWSGTFYKIREAIQNAGFNVIWIPVNKNGIIELCYKFFLTIYEFLFCKGTKIMSGSNRPFLAKLRGRAIRKNDAYKSCDAFFFTGGAGGAQLSLFMDLLGKPSIFFSDATFPIMCDYYWNNLSEKEKKESIDLEKKGVNNTTLNIMSSQWAINSIIKDYGFNPQKSFVLEFGANIDSSDIVPNVPYINGPLNVIFSGVDWIRKGGDIAIETVLNLRKMGIDAHLIIVGIKEVPGNYKSHEFIQCVGFLNKNNPESYRKYINCWKKAHLLLLPTKAECSAIVYCEAAGFGVPVYAYLTGGTGNYVIDGVNGRTFAPKTSSQAIAKKIKEDIDIGNFKCFHEESLKLYETKLSWTAWSKRFRKIIEETNFFN